MLHSTNELKDCAIHATDGTVGHVKDLYFDDASWVIRYLIVDAGTWLASRKVLISPFSIGHPDWTKKVLPVSITKEQVSNSPDIDTDMTVTRQHETTYLGYYGYPYYWGGAGLWGAGMSPGMLVAGYAGLGMPQREEQEANVRAEAARHRDEDPHLRSSNVVSGYYIHARDGDIGHVEGLLVDERTWAIRYIIVNTSNWWLGHQVLIAPQWIKEVSWAEDKVSVDLSREAVKGAPPYDPAAQLDRPEEHGVYEHYGRPGYWVDEEKREAALSEH